MNFLISILFILFNLHTSINTETFYKVFSSENETEINNNIKLLENIKKTDQTNIYLGALLTKKSETIKDVKIKISTFKYGVELIEASIAKNPNNIEYKFIRFIIQQNAPKVLKYNTKLEEDKYFIETNYKNASTKIKKEIEKYAATYNTLSLNIY